MPCSVERDWAVLTADLTIRKAVFYGHCSDTHRQKMSFDTDPIRDYVSYVVYSGLVDALRHGNWRLHGKRQ